METFGSSTLGAIAAFGYAMARALLVGLQAYPELVLVLASISLGWALVRPSTHDDNPYGFAGQALAVAVFMVLFYGARPVDLSSVVGTRLGSSAVNDGAAPWPTWFADEIGQTVNDSVRKLIAGDTTYLVPMLSSAVREAATDLGTLADKQAAANLSAWRLVAAAALSADSTLAGKIKADNLMDRLMNPVSLDPQYASTPSVVQMNQVVALLGSTAPSASLHQLVCVNAAALNKITNDYGATNWVNSDPTCNPAVPGAINVDILGPTTLSAVAQAQGAPSFGDPNMASKAAKGAAAIGALIASHAGQTGQTTFSNLGELYRSIGAGSLVSAAVQAAQDGGFKVLLGEQCQQKGDAICANTFASAYRELSQAVDATDQQVKGKELSWWERLKSGVWKIVAGSIGAVVGFLMNLFAKLVAALSPFCIALARSIAVILSVLGLFLLLLPNRARDAVTMMLGPITFANLWGLLFVVWWKVGELFNDWGFKLFQDAETFSGDGISAAATIQFAVAVGYVSLPAIAWGIVNSATQGLLPRGAAGGAMIAPMVKFFKGAAFAAAMRYVRGGGGSGGTNPSGSPGEGGRGGGGGVPNNPPTPPKGGAQSAANPAAAPTPSGAPTTTRGQAAVGGIRSAAPVPRLRAANSPRY